MIKKGKKHDRILYRTGYGNNAHDREHGIVVYVRRSNVVFNGNFFRCVDGNGRYGACYSGIRVRKKRRKMEEQEVTVDPFSLSATAYYYCPECGAKMDEVEDG